MKRNLIFCQLLTAALLLTGCGFVMEDGQGDPAVLLDPEEQIMETATAAPEPQTEPETEYTDEKPYEFDDITDAQALERLYSPLSNGDYVPGYHVPAESSDFFNLYIPKYDGDPMQELRDSEPNCEMTALGENEFYGIVDFRDLDACPYLVLKQFTLAGNGYAHYKGEMNAESVLTNFDYVAHDKKILARWYRDDPEIKCISYEFYAIEDKGDGTAELGWYCYLIDREDHLVNLQPEWNLKRSIELANVPAAQTAGDPVYDIELSLDKTEILIGRDDPEVVICAVPEVSCKPVSVKLMDADTGEFICDLVDDCDYEAHGDDIQGDGWYCNRWTAPTDFGTDPDVSEEKTFRFYAEFARDGVLHRSETVELTVYEQFTDKELDGHQKVDDAVKALMQTDAWKQANTEQRSELAVACLEQLADEGLVVRESIHAGEDVISYKLPSGIGCGIKLKPFDSRMN